MKRIFLHFLLLLLAIHSIKAQKIEWANTLNGNIDGPRLDDGIYFNYIQPMHEIDQQGNSYLAGNFKDSSYFQNQLLNSKGGADIFIQKFNKDGNVLWTNVLSNSNAKAFSVNNKGEMLLVGEFTDSLKLHQNGLEYVLADSSLGNEFLLKLDSNGLLIWTRQFSGSVVFDQVELADNGDIVLTGYGIELKYGNDTTVAFNPEADFFIVRIDSSGNFEWAKQLDNSSEPINRITSICIDQDGNSLFTGYFFYDMDFDPGPGVFMLGVGGPVRALAHSFVLKLDKQGDFVWAKPIMMPKFRWGSPHPATFGIVRGFNIDLDLQKNMYLSGSFSDSVDFDPGIGTYFFPPKGPSFFILKLDPQGNFKWVYSPNNKAEIRSLEVSQTGSIYSTGRFSGEVDFDPSSSTYNLKSKGLADIFIQKLSSTGGLEWIRHLEGMGEDIGLNVKVNNLEEVFISGQFSDTIDLDPSQNVSNFYPIFDSGKKFFYLKLSNCIPDRSIDIVNSCTGYKWLDGNVYDSSNNTSFIRLMNANGCDSIVTLNLTIPSIDLTTSITDSSILSNDTLSSYRWLDCNDGFSSIPAESAMEFIYSDTGRYAVELTKENCIDTSNCILISATGIYEPSSSDQIIIYPNPTNHVVTIEINKHFSKGVIFVRDLSGRMINKIKFNSQNIPQLNLLETNGLYFIELFLDNEDPRYFKILKQ